MSMDLKRRLLGLLLTWAAAGGLVTVAIVFNVPYWAIGAFYAASLPILMFRLFSKDARAFRRRNGFIGDELRRVGVDHEVCHLMLGAYGVGFYELAKDLTIWEGPVQAGIGALADLPDGAGFDALVEAFDRTPALARVA